MCKRCIAGLNKFWSHLNEKERSDLLMNATSFPMNDGEGTYQELKEMAERSGGDLDLAIAMANDDLDKAMQHAYEQDQKTLQDSKDKV